MPCLCGYPPSGKPSSLCETFHQDTHTGIAYLYNIIPHVKIVSCDWLSEVCQSSMSHLRNVPPPSHAGASCLLADVILCYVITARADYESPYKQRVPLLPLAQHGIMLIKSYSMQGKELLHKIFKGEEW